MWCPEISACGLVDMVILDVESSALEREVCVGTDEWIVSYLDAIIRILRHEIADNWRIIGCVVFSEILEVGSQFTTQDFGNFEVYVKVVISRYFW